MSNKRCSVKIYGVSNVTECFNVIKARLRRKSNVFAKGERFVKSDAKEFNIVDKAYCRTSDIDCRNVSKSEIAL